eukprot:5732511-Pleurochrysis_carterae.AAC.3
MNTHPDGKRRTAQSDLECLCTFGSEQSSYRKPIRASDDGAGKRGRDARRRAVLASDIPSLCTAC